MPAEGSALLSSAFGVNFGLDEVSLSTLFKYDHLTATSCFLWLFERICSALLFSKSRIYKI